MTTEKTTGKTIRLITCEDAFRARLIQGALQNEGIPAVIHNENMSGVLRGFTPTLTGVDIWVYEHDYQAARELLERNQMIPEQLKYCPVCGSDNIRLGLKKGKRLRALLAGVLALLSTAPPGTEHWEWHCRQCGARFAQPVSRHNVTGKEAEA